MEPIIPPLQDKPPRQKTFTPKFIALIVLLLVLGAGAYAGIWYWQKSQIPASLEVPVHKVKTDATADWKTYTNTKYGFELKHPDDWNSGICGQNCIMFGPENNKKYTPVSVVIRFDTLYDARLERLESRNKLAKEEKILINNNEWTKLTFETTSQEILHEYLILDESKTFIFQDIHEIENISNQILTTFKFIQ